MGRYTTGAKAWVAWLALGALGATILRGDPRGASGHEWLLLVAIAACAAAVHLFPTRSARGSATFSLASAFLMAGAILLPPALLSPLVLLALGPEPWSRRGQPGLLIGWCFNLAQTALALHLASLPIQWAGAANLSTVLDVAVLLAAAALFTLSQNLLVGVLISLRSGAPLLATDTLSMPALLTDSLLAVLGIGVAGMWRSAPLLLLLLPPLLVIVRRLMCTAHLAHLAELDVKTGLHNYQHFERALDEELARSRRVGRPLAVLFADLDHFKRVNDRYGHALGDRVLVQTAGLIASALRKTDLVARFGGEEFVALLPGATLDEAVARAERIRAAVEQHALSTGEVEADGPLHVTISIGVAAFPEDGADAASLLRQADAAMYQAKQTRNAVGRPTAAVDRPPTQAATHTANPEQSAAADALPRPAVAIVWTCGVGGSLFAAHSIWSIWLAHAWSRLEPFLLLSLAAELLGVKVYEAGRDRISFSFGAAATMVAVTAIPDAAPFVSLVSAVAHVLLSRRRSLPRLAFNLANPPLAAGIAVSVYAALHSAPTGFDVVDLLAALSAAVAYYVFNTVCVSMLVSLTTRRPWSGVVRESGWSAPINLLLGLIGAFLGGAHEQLGTIGTTMFAAPILILRVTLDLFARRSQQAIAALRTLNGQLEAEIGQRKRFEETLEHQALHDSLTDFPNRNCLLARMQELAEAGRAPRTPFALLLLDLDRFKEINDTFGHQCGDLLLQQLGRRLRDRLPATDTIARLGGDEFGVLVPGADVDAATHAARVVLEALQEPLVLDDQTLEVGASIGIAVSPAHGLEPDVLLRRADVAMYVAKRDHTHLAVYDSAQDQHSPERLQLVGELRRAIEGGRLTLYYQPTASFRSSDVIGCEALVRWRHPERGLVPPDQFIQLAENTGLIRPLSRWVLGAAVQQARAWRDRGLELRVSVNLSMRDLQDPQLPDVIAGLLAESNLEPGCLRLEITESAVMANVECTSEVLGRLRGLGMQIAVDDFGTGYSSLAYLKRLPVDELKIDRSFVRYMAKDRHDLAIVRSTIALAHDLGLSVVAEGVEDRATWELLARQGCDVAQGYFLSPPLPVDAFEAWLERRDEQRWRAA